MYRRSFPKCMIKGSFEPVPFSHMGSMGCVPKKCSLCKYLFEGECTRALKQVAGYLALDHGPCKIEGDTIPELIDSAYVTSKVYVPSKCKYCLFLSFDFIRGFYCNFEREKWGDFPRAVDWGNWSPELPNVGLESRKIVSIDLIKAVKEGKEAEAIKIFQEINKGTSIKEARDAFRELKEKLNSF